MKIIKTDYTINPVGINNLTPRFSWVNDKKQKYYSIVAKDAFTKEVLWDSGRIFTEESVGAEYCGKQLKSRQRVNVYLEVGYEDGKTERGEGFFELGITDKSEWHGAWVGTNAEFNANSLIVREEFFIGKKDILRARVYLVALGYHELFINGEKVDDRKLAPSQTDYTRRICYVTYPVEKFLRPGKNCIAVHMGHGWFGKRTMLAQIYVDYADGEVFEDHTEIDGKWWQTAGPVIGDGIYQGETYDARIDKNIGKWKETDGVFPTWGNGWLFTFRALQERAELVPEVIEPIKVNGAFGVKSVNVLPNGETVYDFGQNIAGWVNIRVRGEVGAKITMRFAEDLKDDGSINQLNLRSAACTDTYILAGGEAEDYAPSFTYHGFRYMQMKIEGKAEIIRVVAEHVYNSVKNTGTFSCSDETVNKLHEMAVMTEKNNLHSIMTDCPQRDERLMWLNDLSSRIYQNINNFDLAKMLRKCVYDFMDTQRENGAIADTAPFIGGTIPADPVCAAMLVFTLNAYRFYGDKALVNESYGACKKWVDFLVGKSDNYIVGYSYYGDWVMPEKYIKAMVSGEYISSAYVYWQIKLLSQLAGICGNEADALKYGEMAKESAAALNGKFFDKKNIRYENGSQTANAIAVSFGFAAKEYIPELVRQINDDVIAENYHLTCGNQGYKHVLYALAENGYSDTVIRALTNREYPGWGYMVECGATTVWERWEKEMQCEMHSFDHPMFSAYDGVFYNCFAGINVENDAYACNEITIKPQTDNDLTFVKASVETVRGLVSSEWEKQDGKIIYKIILPYGAKGKLVLDEGKTVIPLESGDNYFKI